MGDCCNECGGITLFKGDKGETGATGATGDSGTNGTNGADGKDGRDGLFGGFASNWTFNGYTDEIPASDPTSGKVNIIVDYLSNPWQLVVNDTNKGLINMDAFLDSFYNSGAYGYVKVYKRFDSGTFLYAQITSYLDAGAYHVFGITPISSNATFFATDEIVIDFTPIGIPFIPQWTQISLSNSDLTASTGTFTTGTGFQILRYLKNVINKTITINFYLTNCNTSSDSIAYLGIKLPETLNCSNFFYGSGWIYNSNTPGSPTSGEVKVGGLIVETATGMGSNYLRVSINTFNNFDATGSDNIKMHGQITLQYD